MKYYLVLLILLTSCTTIPFEDGTLETMFCPGKECIDYFLNKINLSEEVICAFYDIDYDPLIKLLKEKKADVIVDYRNLPDNSDFKPIKSKGLMHHKFCVLNNKFVLTGSLNPTINGFTKNANNIVFINSSMIAENYQAEFDFLKNGKKQKIRHKLNLSGKIIETYFCSRDDCEKQVIKILSNAKNEIYFLNFVITSNEIGDLLLEKSNNVIVKGLIENMMKNVKGGEFVKLSDFTKVYSSKGKLHHKIFISDDKVITGSYNPTSAGNNKNDENMIIIHDETISSRFKNEFNYLSSFSS